MKDNPFFADAINLFNSGVGFMTELREQITQDMKERFTEQVDKLDLIKRSEFEAEIKALRKEIAVLKGEAAPAAPKAAAPKKAAAKKAASKKAAAKK